MKKNLLLFIAFLVIFLPIIFFLNPITNLNAQPKKEEDLEKRVLRNLNQPAQPQKPAKEKKDQDNNKKQEIKVIKKVKGQGTNPEILRKKALYARVNTLLREIQEVQQGIGFDKKTKKIMMALKFSELSRLYKQLGDHNNASRCDLIHLKLINTQNK